MFESSHVKLHMWLQAAYLMCSSKKGISSNQLSRVLGVGVKTAWFMSHRLRKAMAGGVLPAMGGEDEIVEIDETYIGDKGTKKPAGRGYTQKHAVLTLVERGKGARSFHVDGTRLRTHHPARRDVIHRGSEVSDVPSGSALRCSDEAARSAFLSFARARPG